MTQVAQRNYRLVFASAFVPMQSVDSPSVRLRKKNGGNQTSAQQAAEAYYECLIVLFASARRWHPEAHLVLFTPAEVPIWFGQSAQSLNLELIPQPFWRLPPNAGSGRRFVSSLYTLDAIDWIAAHGSEKEIFMLLDADTVVTGTLEATRWVEKLGYLGWALKPGYDFNGLPLAKYQDLVSKSGLPKPVNPQIVGGEFLAGSTAVFHLLANETARVEQLDHNNASDGELALTTEEQVLSLAVPYLARDNSRDIANRIWTAPHHRTTDGAERKLLIWHLPSEKGRGFHDAAHAATDDRSWLWRTPREEFLNHIGKTMGVTTRTPHRVAQDWVQNAKRRLRSGSSTGDPVLYGPPW